MKREREKHITRLHIILFFLVVIIVISVILIIKGISGSSNNKYYELEDEIINATNTYIKLEEVEIKDGYEKKIDIEELSGEDAYIQNDLINECEGYVIISREKTDSDEYENVITPYIKCGNKYKTTNYEAYE